MRKKSRRSKDTRKSAAQIPVASEADIGRLRAAMKDKIDTREIPERKHFQPLKRVDGKLPARKSVLREAVSRQMEARNLTAYRVWKLAREHYPPLSQSAVHEFLKGQRQLELASIEALLAAVDLRVIPANAS